MASSTFRTGPFTVVTGAAATAAGTFVAVDDVAEVEAEARALANRIVREFYFGGVFDGMAGGKGQARCLCRATCARFDHQSGSARALSFARSLMKVIATASSAEGTTAAVITTGVASAARGTKGYTCKRRRRRRRRRC